MDEPQYKYEWLEQPATKSQSMQVIVYAVQKAIAEWRTQRSTNQNDLNGLLWEHVGQEPNSFKIACALAEKMKCTIIWFLHL